MKLSFLLVFTSLTCFATPPNTAPKLDYCESNKTQDVKKINIPTKPSYFFRVFGNANKVSFASGGENYILDITTNKIVTLPGEYDPVPLGESVMSVPNKRKGMAYYSISEILKGNPNPEVLFKSPDMKGVYQSTGLLEKGSGYDIYGLIAAGSEEIQFQKIKVSYLPNLKVEALGEIQSLCPGWDIKMPMISKDAQEISGFDAAQGVSKIWKIHHDVSNQCTEVDNLGVFAAKADFSYDSKKLVFHLNANGSTYKLKKNGSGEIDWVETPTAEMSQSVFQYDRASKTLNRISFNQPGSNAYYPVYQKNGSVLYAVVEANGESRFELVAPEKMNSTKMSLLDGSDQFKSLSVVAIGKLWNLVCSPKIPIKSPETLSVTALGLNQKSCLDLVNNHWNRNTHLEVVKSEVVTLAGSRIAYRKDLMSLLELRDLLNVCVSLDTE